MILLDTCALLWLVSDQTKLSAKAKECISKNANELFVSAITAFEIAIKQRNGKLELPIPAAEWYLEAINFHGVHEISLTGAIAIASAFLPPHHNDPCDRIIIATASVHTMKIITSDNLIGQYDQADVIW